MNRGEKKTEIGSLIINDDLLYLLDLNFSILPEEIGQLTNLRRVAVIGAPLKHLPTEVSQLTNLSELEIRHCPLMDLPQEIGQLTNLRALTLMRVSLTHLPECIENLTNLEFLSLDYSKMVERFPFKRAEKLNPKLRIAVDETPLQSMVFDGQTLLRKVVRKRGFYLNFSLNNEEHLGLRTPMLTGPFSEDELSNEYTLSVVSRFSFAKYSSVDKSYVTDRFTMVELADVEKNNPTILSKCGFPTRYYGTADFSITDFSEVRFEKDFQVDEETWKQIQAGISNLWRNRGSSKGKFLKRGGIVTDTILKLNFDYGHEHFYKKSTLCPGYYRLSYRKNIELCNYSSLA